MHRYQSVVAIVGMFFMFLPTLAFGNAAPPDDLRGPVEPIVASTTNVQIVVDEGHAGPPTLSIPSDVAGKKGAAPIGLAPSIPPINMIVIGVALSLAVLLGGFWLMKQKSLAVRVTAAVGALIVGSVVVTQYAQADIAPPRPRPRPIDRPIEKPINNPVKPQTEPAKQRSAEFKAVVSNSAEGDTVILTLSPAQLKALGGKLKE